jgi:hypothetical protein
MKRLRTLWIHILYWLVLPMGTLEGVWVAPPCIFMAEIDKFTNRAFHDARVCDGRCCHGLMSGFLQ